MPNLKCNVERCQFNCGSLCSKNAISVDGPHSFSKSETSCRSFISKDSDDFLSEFAEISEDAKLQTNVYCDAYNCAFQKDLKCCADRIEIRETPVRDSAKYHHESMCKTFECVDHN